ncbi:MAG: hypothetical protein AAGL98_03835 [Planctomycetota bacterium]
MSRIFSPLIDLEWFGTLVSAGVLTAIVIGGFCGGCVSGVADPRAVWAEPTVRTDDYRAAFDAGVAVLRDAGFRIDRQGFRFGRISSEPQGSPVALEAWKPDNAGAREAWLSTLSDLRRTVVVSILPADADADADIDADADVEPAGSRGPAWPPGAYRLRIEVLLERRQVPGRRLDGRTQGTVFADLAEVPAELRRRGIAGRYWQPIGRDLALEQYLTRKIFEQTRPAPG